MSSTTSLPDGAPPSSPTSLRPSVRLGTTVGGRYVVGSVMLDTRGFACLQVRDTHLDERATLTIPRATSVEDPAFAESFLREARRVHRLHNAHVLSVVDVGCLRDGTPYVITDAPEGESVADFAKRRGTVSLEEAAAWMSEACDGLADAHAEGIVHGRLTASDLFLSLRPSGLTTIVILGLHLPRDASVSDNPAVDLLALRNILKELVAPTSEGSASLRDAMTLFDEAARTPKTGAALLVKSLAPYADAVPRSKRLGRSGPPPVGEPLK